MVENNTPLRTALYKQHIANSATMGEEGGWEMPVSYRGGLAEADDVRHRAGLFDASHLGRIRIRGDGALDLLERVCTTDVAHQEDDTAAHTLLCNESGGIIDECFLLRLSNMWVLTTNASNRHKVLSHLQAQQVDSVKIDDQTEKVSQLVMAGPAAEEILEAVLPINVTGLKTGQVRMGTLLVANYIASRTGYSNQWTLEVMVPAMFAGQAWAYITQKAADKAVKPCGLASRDVLRIEAGLCRYGHETNETIDPAAAGLAGCVDFGHDFIGAEAIRKIIDKGPARKRVSLALAGQGEVIPRLGEAITRSDGGEIGTVTSGTFSPKQDAIIAMGYVSASEAQPDAEVLLGGQNSLAARITKIYE
jgi:aminomethyltransferase